MVAEFLGAVICSSESELRRRMLAGGKSIGISPWDCAFLSNATGPKRREAGTCSRSSDHLIANQRIDQITAVTAILQQPGKRWVEVRFSGENECGVIRKFSHRLGVMARRYELSTLPGGLSH